MGPVLIGRDVLYNTCRVTPRTTYLDREPMSVSSVWTLLFAFYLQWKDRQSQNPKSSIDYLPIQVDLTGYSELLELIY